MTQASAVTAALNAPATTTPTGLTVGISPQQRLELAMRRANEADPNNIPDPTAATAPWSYSSVGVPNPYGQGIKAYEPNNIIFDAYREAKAESDASKAAEDAAKPQTVNIPGVDSVLGDATGKVGSAVQAALNLAQRAVPYVWGGTTANGVDCSGLIYYAFRSAGIDLPRYRAVDYGHMGTAVSVDQARAGDIVYYDEPGDTDHVGIYLGNGLMVQAPTTGDHVRVSSIGKATSIRRIFDDNAFGVVATPTGIATSYNGSAYDPTYRAPISPASGPVGSTITRTPSTGTGYRTKAI